MTIGNLLSGFFAALVATLLAIAYQSAAESLRIKAELTISIVLWLDGVYGKLQDLQVQKDGDYGGGKPLLAQDEYNITSRQIRSDLSSNNLSVRIALVFGEGAELIEFNKLKGKLLCVAETLWHATKETWGTDSKAILSTFKSEIDPGRRALERKLLEKASSKLLLKKAQEFLTRERGWKQQP